MKHNNPEDKFMEEANFFNLREYNSYEELLEAFNKAMDSWEEEEEPHQAKGEIFLEIFQKAAGN